MFLLDSLSLRSHKVENSFTNGNQCFGMCSSRERRIQQTQNSLVYKKKNSTCIDTKHFTMINLTAKSSSNRGGKWKRKISARIQTPVLFFLSKTFLHDDSCHNTEASKVTASDWKLA